MSNYQAVNMSPYFRHIESSTMSEEGEGGEEGGRKVK